jgi:hypothetical protein
VIGAAARHAVKNRVKSPSTLLCRGIFRGIVRADID